MPRIGYARVSTVDQDLEGQLSRLRTEGCAIVRAEKISGANREGRAELATVIEFLRPGDELVVTRLDRLGRDTRDVFNVVHEAEQRGASVTVLDSHVSTRGEMGHVVLTVLGMVAQMERRFIKELQREGIVRAKAEGAYKSGKWRLDHDRIRALAADGRAQLLPRSAAHACRSTGSCNSPHRASNLLRSTQANGLHRVGSGNWLDGEKRT